MWRDYFETLHNIFWWGQEILGEFSGLKSVGKWLKFEM